MSGSLRKWDAVYELGHMPNGLIEHGVWVGIIHDGVSADPGIGDEKDIPWVCTSHLCILCEVANSHRTWKGFVWNMNPYIYVCIYTQSNNLTLRCI